MNNFLEKSNFFLYFCAEKKEILTHKWYESEKAGQDVGFDFALIDWKRKHFRNWREHYRLTNGADCRDISL